MPRLQPSPGYTTAADAAKRLNVSDSLLSRYVAEGKLHRYGPPERKHKFYKISEIDALLTAERFFYGPGQWKLHPSSTFEQATEVDMPSIVEISARIFDAGPPIPVEPRLIWLRKNPETFFALRNQQGIIVGYASLLPLKRAVIDRFIRDELGAENITAEDVEPFEPSKPLHLYVMAIGIDPHLSTREKHEYGAALVRGLFAFLFDLAQRGVEIETITARSHKPDGLRLLRKLGIPQLRSPVPGKSLFAVRVADSGFPLFERYSELLASWQQSHQEPRRTPVPVSPLPSTPAREKVATAPRERPTAPQEPREQELSTYASPRDLPPDTLSFQDFLSQHGLKHHRRRVLGYLERQSNGLRHEAFQSNRPNELNRYLTPDQQSALLDWLRASHPDVFKESS